MSRRKVRLFFCLLFVAIVVVHKSHRSPVLVAATPLVLDQAAPPRLRSYIVTGAPMIARELAEAPESIQREVLNFLLFLKGRPAPEPTVADDDEDNPPVQLLSEAALAEDWLSPETEEAWKNL